MRWHLAYFDIDHFKPFNDRFGFRQGDRVILLLASANREESLFPDPDKFDILRKNAAEHIAFGRGVHFCLGAPLARLEGQIALKRLLDRFPGIRLRDGLVPEWHDSLIMRGITSMPINLR